MFFGMHDVVLASCKSVLQQWDFSLIYWLGYWLNGWLMIDLLID